MARSKVTPAMATALQYIGKGYTLEEHLLKGQGSRTAAFLVSPLRHRPWESRPVTMPTVRALCNRGFVITGQFPTATRPARYDLTNYGKAALADFPAKK